MSVVRKIPYIESVLSRLTANQLGTLASKLNSNEAAARYSLVDSDSFIPALDDGDIIAPVVLVLEKGKPGYNGYLIHVTDKDNDALTVFIGYHRFQDLKIIEIDPVHRTFKEIKEYLDINELRRCINELGGSQTGGLTPAGLLGLLDVSDGIVADLSEDGTKVEVHLDQDILDFVLPKEVPLEKIVHDPGESNTIITVSEEVFDPDNGYDVSLEIESTGVHYGASFKVMPYNGSQCLTVFYMIVNGDVKECFASLDESGQLIIDLPFVMTPESQDTTIFYKRSR